MLFDGVKKACAQTRRSEDELILKGVSGQVDTDGFDPLEVGSLPTPPVQNFPENKKASVMDESLNYKSENYKRKRIGKRKPELIDKIVEKTGYQRSKVEKITDALFESITEITRAGEPLFIQGFGSFRSRKIGEHVTKKHHISGEEAVTPEHWRLTFKDYNTMLDSAGTEHRRRLNRRYGVWGDDAVEMLDEFVRRANENRKARLKADAQKKKEGAECSSSMPTEKE